MRLLGLDFETTGLDTGNDRIIEIGAALWDVGERKPITTFNWFVYDPTFPTLTPELTKIHGITQDMLLEFGEPPGQVYRQLEEFCKEHKSDFLVAHNAENFDKAILLAEVNRFQFGFETIKAMPWIDTRTDIPFLVEPSSRRLNHLASDHGFINPFQHRALFDVLTMLRVLANYDITQVLEYQKIPFVTVQAMVTYDERQLAKGQRFSWEQIGDKKYPRMWVKRIKKNLLELEKQNCKFPIKEIN